MTGTGDAMAEVYEGPQSIDQEAALAMVGSLYLPLLGTRTIVQHQRTLFVLVGLAIAVLLGMAGYAVSKGDKIAQQVAASGQSLMQSQRLAKSVSQALVGSEQAFPDVAESSSVLAKTYRDDYMKNLHARFPHYNWASNKGYGTLEHREAIEQFGICPYHRKSFNILPSQTELF